MEIFIKEDGKINRSMERGYLRLKMEINMYSFGKKEKLLIINHCLIELFCSIIKLFIYYYFI
jgi:hypothetical protein